MLSFFRLYIVINKTSFLFHFPFQLNRRRRVCERGSKQSIPRELESSRRTAVCPNIIQNEASTVPTVDNQVVYFSAKEYSQTQNMHGAAYSSLKKKARKETLIKKQQALHLIKTYRMKASASFPIIRTTNNNNQGRKSFVQATYRRITPEELLVGLPNELAKDAKELDP